MKDPNDTICALSTAPGRAGLAVVRMSGLRCFGILDEVIRPEHNQHAFSPRTSVLGRFVDPGSREEIDQVLVIRFPAPHSYTGEDVAEISLHGSPVLVGGVLDVLCGRGARLAAPGEFTLRAFLHRRLDLAQAEAVRDIIEANTLYQARVAARQRDGALSKQLEPLKALLVDIIVQLEAAVEFVEEDLVTDSREALALRLEEVRGKIAAWVASFKQGRIVREGFSLAVVGRPNVGKSSVFNRMLSQERSIVTEVPGTTRDLVSEYMNLEGIPVRMVDTAGVRDAEDAVERMGVDRSYRAMADADAILHVVDASVAGSVEDIGLRERLSGLPCVVVFNKSDLPSAWPEEEQGQFAGAHPRVTVSALTGSGIPALRRAILAQLFGDGGPPGEGLLVTNLRHCRCLEDVLRSVTEAQKALRDALSEEFVLLDLHAALKELGAITGETTMDDLLDGIFSRFCVGK
jgi:tRNA modification GTPase